VRQRQRQEETESGEAETSKKGKEWNGNEPGVILTDSETFYMFHAGAIEGKGPWQTWRTFDWIHIGWQPVRNEQNIRFSSMPYYDAFEFVNKALELANMMGAELPQLPLETNRTEIYGRIENGKWYVFPAMAYNEDY
jgi:hypothetical protein